MKYNTARLLLSSLLYEPTKIALGDSELQITRSVLIANVAIQAEAMLKAGIETDDFYILLCDRGPKFWVELLAGWVIGAKPVCLESNVGPDHAASILEMTDAQFIFGSNVPVVPAFSSLKSVVSTFDPTAESSDVRSTFMDLPFAADESMPDLAGLIFTSGTTGLPKGVPLSHRILSINALSTASRINLRQEDRLLIATPFRFISSISHFIVTLISGGAFFGIEKTLMIKDLLVAINKLDITAFGGSPFHVQFLAMAGEKRLPNLRWIMSSGDYLRPAVIDQIEANFSSLELHVVYGMAELGGRFCSLPSEAKFSKKGSVGYPIGGYEFAILDENLIPCEVGEIGDIYVRGLLEFQGYYKNDSANNEVLTKFGFRNGDKGYLDADGYLFLSGRSDAVFKRSGLKVSAQLVSDAIIALEEVKDVFVGSEDDPLEGKVPVAYISWAGEKAFSLSELNQKLRDLLPANHLPNRLIPVSQIPRTGSGKIDRGKLTRLVASEHD